MDFDPQDSHFAEIFRFGVKSCVLKICENLPKTGFYVSESKLAQCKYKILPILEIKDLVFMLCSIKQSWFGCGLVINALFTRSFFNLHFDDS